MRRSVNRCSSRADCDALGFHRFWVSEHHNSASIVGTAPEILIAAIAATTRRIRVGSAGVMLPHYSALKVAEQFRVLEAIAPGRIDLGVGRAPGSDGLTARALNPHSTGADEFPRQVQELQHWVSGVALPEGHPFDRVWAHPLGPTSPDDLDSRQLRLWRAARRALGSALCVRVFLSGRRRCRGGLEPVPAQLPAERSPSAAAADDLRLGAGRRQRGGGTALVERARALARRFREGPARTPDIA
jgi:hypothetical protein